VVPHVDTQQRMRPAIPPVQVSQFMQQV
jgi:hypothetical protein